MTTREQRLLRMLVASVAGHVVDKSTSSRKAWRCCGRTRRCAPSCSSSWTCSRDRVDHVHTAPRASGRRAAAGPRALLAHRDPRRVRRRRVARRSRPGRRASTGRRSGADLLAFTLDKTSGKFSPTTRYRDYAISRELIHWESQSMTRADSETGRAIRSTQSARRSCCSRDCADDRAFWFLGPATTCDTKPSADGGDVAVRAPAAGRSVRIVRGRGG